MAPGKETPQLPPSSRVKPEATFSASRGFEREETRLPYLIDAALRLRGRLDHVEPGAWARPASVANCEERESNEHHSPVVGKRRVPYGRGKLSKTNYTKKVALRQLPDRAAPNSHGNDEKASQNYVPSLPALDERVLILYHSSLTRVWKKQRQESELNTPASSLNLYGHEAIYAATQIQKVTRGMAARIQWQTFFCLRNQNAASRIQFAFRRIVVCRKVLARLTRKRHDRATRIQAWYKGHRCRTMLLYQHIRVMNQRITNFQRYIRGRRLWRIVMAILHKRRSDVAVEIQRCYRGWKGRQRVVDIRFEQNRHVRQLECEVEVHSQRSRCKGCDLTSCTEDSLFACFMVRYVGLHDFKGAKTLGEDGLRLFPLSSKFSLLYSVLLQTMGEDMETSMAFLKRAKEIGIHAEEMLQCETQYFLPAHLLRPNDAQAFLDLAILCQCRDQLSRAEANYSRALAQSPQDYAIPGYLHRVHMVDRLLLNYHRFCSIFNFRQVNVLLKEVFTSKKGKKVRVMVSKFNHYTVIAPMDDTHSYRMNSLYLTDDEVLTIIKPPIREGEKESSSDGGNPSASYRGTASWGSSSVTLSMRQKSFRSVLKGTPERSSRLIYQKPEIAQLYQQEFVGLNVRPNELARISESRSKVRLTKANAEFLLNGLVFVDPTVLTIDQSDEGIYSESSPSFIHKVMLISSIMKLRQVHRNAITRSHATIHTQRVYRGFWLRAEVRRDKLLNDIRQQQADEMYRRLHENFLARELRRSSAIAIQRVFKGYSFRNLLRRRQTQACHIQRIFRGYHGRLRAAAFREGTCSFYMAQRVFQRGMNISGHFVMLIIEKCGLSFRLDGYDLEACVTYHGFFSHASTMNLLCYLNGIYGGRLIGREFTRKGDKMVIRNVSSVNRLTAECFVHCESLSSKAGILVEMSLVVCVQAINLRNFGVGDKDPSILQLPMTPEDNVRLVEALAQRAILIPALRAPTKELNTRDCSDFIISVKPPPRMHFTYQRKTTFSYSKAGMDSTIKTATHLVSPSTAPGLVFPVVDGLRGVSIGKNKFRNKCSRHAVQFTRCRCMLSIVSTSAHVEAISRALAPPLLGPSP